MKVFVHIHIFYEHLVPELRTCLSNIETVCGKNCVRSVITYPTTKPELKGVLKAAYPLSCILALPNLGYDIGPFFEAIHDVNLDAFDYLVKLHSKRDVTTAWVNFRPLHGETWRKLLLSFCNTPKAFARTLRALERQPSLGMIAHHRLIDPSGVGSCHHPEWAEELLKRLKLTLRGRTIVYGTMFICRAPLMKPFQQLRLADCDELDPNEAHHITGLASSAEGAFGMAIEAQGYRVAEGRLPAWAAIGYYAILRCLYSLVRKLSLAARGARDT